MPLGEGLFRRSALEKLSSPEQLDVMMKVTSPAGWLALAGTGVILLFVVVWSVVGKIAIRVDGQGLLLRGSAVLDITSGAQGRVTEVLVKPGDSIQPGQVVARIAQPELKLRIQNAEEQIRTLSAQGVESGARGASVIAQYQSQVRDLREKAETQRKLVARGLLTRGTLLRTQSELAAAEQAIAQSQIQKSGQENRVDELKGQLKEYMEKLASSTEIRSVYSGRVLEVTLGAGGLVAEGTRILTLEPADAPLQTVIYIPAAEGKRVRPGMRVRITPSTVKVEEYGFMIGTVKSVSEFPVTPEGLRRVLRNDKLVETLMGQSAPIEVVAALIPDQKTPSGYRWSSSNGPPAQVLSGTMAAASVVVETRRPISYVLPIIKKSIGA